MTKDEALKLALEALEEYADHEGKTRAADKAITAIQAALAQPEQEPVAWEQFHEHLVERNFCPRCGKRTADLTTIHTCTPPQTIADEHIAKVTSDIDLAVNKALVEEDDDIQDYKKPWVDLTQEERFEIRQRKWWDWEDAFDIDGFMQAIEAKLKEKNT